MKFNGLTVFVIFACSIASTFAQENKTDDKQKPSKTVDYVRDYGHSTLIVQSRNQFIKHANALLKDINFEGLAGTAESLINEGQNGEMDTAKPIIMYRVTGGTLLTETTVKNRDTLRAQVKDKPEWKDWSVPKEVDLAPVGSEWFFGASRRNKFHGIVNGEQFAIGRGKKSLSDWRSSKRLKPQLAKRTQDLINKSGICYIESFSKSHDPLDLFSGVNEAKFEGDEKKAANQLNALAKAGQFFVFGTTYENSSLELNFHAQFKKNEAVNQLFDLKNAAKPFATTRGLPKEGLVASVSANLKSLRSPSTVRVLSREAASMIESAFGRRRSKVLDRTIIHMGGELIAESWHDIAAIRAGVYIIDEEKSTESMAVIVIVDPRKPDEFMTELTKMMTLIDKTDTPETNEKRAAELQKWIDKLDSRSYETRKRATTRLMLAGSAAEPYLRKVANTGSPEKRMRIRMVLKQLETNSAKAAKILVENKGFLWPRIQPSYSLKLNAEKIGQFPVHEIRIQAGKEIDEKTKKKYQQEMKAVFGHQWATMKLVQVKDQFVLALGGTDELLRKTTGLIASGKDPIRATFEKNKRRLNAHHQLEFNFSAPRIVNLLNYDKPEKHAKPNDDHFSSFGLKIDHQTWESTIHLPANELEVLLRNWLP